MVLNIGAIEEADPERLIPTTSTTATLALGDALTVALMVKRDFRPEQFAVLHPKGMLSKRLTLKVTDLLRGGETNPVLPETATFEQALETITKFALGGVCLTGSGGELTGILTDGDVRRIIQRWEKGVCELREQKVEDLMTKSPKRISHAALAYDALTLMETNKPRPIFVLPVVDDSDMPVGLLHLHALVRAGFKASAGNG